MESLIIGVIVGIVLAIAFTAMVVLGKSQAKKDARAMIAEGRITDIKKYSVTMNCLAKNHRRPGSGRPVSAAQNS